MKRAGRKLKYGEKLELMRVPESMVPQIQAAMKKREVLVEVTELPPLADELVKSIANVLHAQGSEVRETCKLLLELALQSSSDEIKPLIQAKLTENEESEGERDHVLKLYVDNVRTLFNAIGDPGTTDLRLI